MYVASRFGQDSPSRIATSAELYLEATEMPPVPEYQSLVPFLPPSIVLGDGGFVASSTVATGGDDWTFRPDRLDLKVYQGDDFQVPLFFKDASRPTLDMSDWDWKGQVRIRHRYYSRLVTEFTITAELIEPTPPDDVNTTLVTLFLPRYHNRFAGVWSWDLHSTGPFEGPTFPKPPDVAEEDWPMIDQVKTWLYGYMYVVPRTTETDHLPIPPNYYPAGPITVTPQGWTVGPNGRVP